MPELQVSSSFLPRIASQESLEMEKVHDDGFQVFSSGNIVMILPTLLASGSIGNKINEATSVAKFSSSCPQPLVHIEDRQDFEIKVHIYLPQQSDDFESNVQRTCKYTRKTIGVEYSDMTILHLTNYSTDAFLSMWHALEYCLQQGHTKSLALAIMDLDFVEFKKLWLKLEYKPCQVLIPRNYHSIKQLREFAAIQGFSVLVSSKSHGKLSLTIDIGPLNFIQSAAESLKPTLLIRYDVFSTNTSVLLSSGYLLEAE